MFSNKVYTLPDGKYRAYITLGKFIVRDGKHRWLLNFEFEDGRIFETQFALPLNPDFGFGKAIYELKDQIKEFTGDCIENNYVTLEIKNRIYNDRNYSNISSMRLDNEIEQEI